MPSARPKPHRRGRAATLPPELRRVNPNAAGVDVGAGSHYVAVPDGRDPEGCDVREFRAFTADLYALADWLTRCDIETVAMESTGVYWIPLFELLSERGFEVRLVDPRQLKSVPGRKTDVLLRDPRCKTDAETIARALEGTWRPEHLFALRQALELVEFYHTQIAACDHEIEAQLLRFEDKSDGRPLADASRPRKARRTAPRFDAREHLHRLTGVDLTRIDGIDAPTALKVVAEIGLDMNFPASCPRAEDHPGRTGGASALILQLAESSVAESHCRREPLDAAPLLGRSLGASSDSRGIQADRPPHTRSEAEWGGRSGAAAGEIPEGGRTCRADAPYSEGRSF